MPWSFWASYLLKLGVVGMLLGALYAIASTLRRLRGVGCRGDRSIRIIETVALSQHAAVYLLRVGTRYLLVGTAGDSVALLGELAAPDQPPPAVTR